MRTKFTICIAATALLAVGAAMADYTTGVVSGLTAKQRYPWNGLVDISFTLSGPESSYCVAIAATNAATGAALPVCTLRDTSGNALYKLTFAPGSVSFVWDAGVDAPGILVETLVLSVITAPHPWRGRFQLWEGGPYWAETNIGAEEPWEYGLYFWWGDTVGYRREGNAWVASDGSSSNFSFSSGNAPTYGKYPSTLQSEGWVVSKNGTYVLAPAHDAAQVHWGGGWRMPMKQELDDLSSKCDWTWTTLNDVYGCVVRGRGDYASASIFLPATGTGGTSLSGAGVGSGYWSSVSYSDGGLYSWSLFFTSSRHGTSDDYYHYSIRYYGYVVRPVLEFTEGLAATPVSVHGDTTTLRLDTRTEPLAADAIVLSWNASWIGGDAGATVVISDNGAEVRRTTGAGEFTHTPVGTGRHNLTYTTYIGGVAQEEVYGAVVYKDKYTILFDANGGEGTMADCEVGVEMPFTLPDGSFTKDGHFLLGWALTPSGEATLLDGDSTEDITAGAGETVTLYAVWHEGAARGNGLTVKYYDISSSGYSTWSVSEEALTNYFAAYMPTIETNTLAYGETLDPGIAGVDQSSVNRFRSWGLNELRFEVNGTTNRFHGKYTNKNQENIATYLSGEIETTTSGTYSFACIADDFEAIFIDGVRVCRSQWNSIGSGSLELAAGTHTFRMGFHEGDGGHGFAVEWKKPGDVAWSPLPQSVLSSGGRTTYAVRFDANGGVGTMAKRVYAAGDDVTLPAYVREGWRFVGWATAPDGAIAYDDVDAIDGGLDAANGETVTLFARWAQSQYAVHFNANDGAGTMADESFWIGIPNGLSSNAFARTGYTFAGWAMTEDGEVAYGDKAFVTNLTETANATVNLYAVWTAHQYEVRFNSNLASGSMANQTFTYDVAAALSSNAFERMGYTFAGWATENGGAKTYDDGEVIENLSSTNNAVIDLYATWTMNTYSVVFDANGGEGAMATQAFTYDAPQALTSNGFNREDLFFAGWATTADGAVAYGDGEEIANLTAEANGVVTLYAVWADSRVIFNAKGGEGTMEPFFVFTGTEQTLPEGSFTKNGHFFLGWALTSNGEATLLDGDSTADIAVEAGETVTLYAVWHEGTGGGDGLLLKYYDISSSGYSTWTQSEEAMTNYFVAYTPTLEANTHDWTIGLSSGNVQSAPSSSDSQWMVNAGMTSLEFNAESSRFHGKYSNASQSYFSVLFQGKMKIDIAGLYWFACMADDQIVVYIDGTRVCNTTWANYATGSLNLEKGLHRVVIAYRQNSGGHGFSVQWKKPGETLYSPLPQSILSYGTTTHAVRFDVNGGTGIMQKRVYATGDNVTLPVYAREGWTLLGWATEPNGPITYADGETIAGGFDAANGETMTLYARWEPNDYAVTFNGDGGGVAFNEKTVTFETAYGALPSTSRTGYTFNGWTLYGNVVTAETICTTPSNHVLTATWTPNEYTVTFDANGGAVEPAAKTVTFDEVYGELPIADSLELHTFRRWLLDGIAVTADTIVASASNHVLVADWNIAFAGGVWEYPEGDGPIALGAPLVAPTGDVVIPAEIDGRPIVAITDEAFAENTAITSVTIPASVTNVAEDVVTDIPGLKQVKFNSRYDTSSTPEDVDEANVATVSGVIAAYTKCNSSPWSFADPLSGDSFAWNSQNTTFAYIGQMWMEAGKTYVFGAHFDDDAFVKVDGQVIINAYSSNDSRVYTGSFQCGETGWHDVDFRVSDQNGGKGSWGKTWSENFGLGYRDDGLTDSNQNGWKPLLDPGDGSLFRCGVSNVSTSAFAGCTGLRKVSIGRLHADRLADIFPDATDSIEEVVFLEGVEAIPDNFFAGCSALRSMDIAESVVEIGTNVFEACSELATTTVGGLRMYQGWCLGREIGELGVGELVSLVVPGSYEAARPEGSPHQSEIVTVRGIAAGVFRGETEIATATLPESLRFIGAGAFEGCTRLENVIVPEGVRKIDRDAFRNCTRAQGLSLPTSLRAICDGAFANCTRFQNVSVPSGVEEIGAIAFSNCWRVTSVSIPQSVERIGEGAFADCENITGAVVPLHVRPMAELFPASYDAMTDVWIAEIVGQFDGLTVGQLDGLTASRQMVEGMFAGCAAVEEIELPEWVRNVPDRAFEGCWAIEALSFPDAVTNIGARACASMASLETVAFPASLATIGVEAFDGDAGIASLALPDGLRAIGARAFRGLSLLARVDIPASAREVGAGAYAGCAAIRAVTLPGDAGTASEVFPSAYDKITSAMIVSENGSLGELAPPVLRAQLLAGCSALTRVELPQNLAEIGASAFADCSALTEVGVPAAVTNIGASAFADCTSLSSIALPKNLETIEDGTFAGCSSLVEITIPESVREIGSGLFARCTLLRSVRFVGNAPAYPAGAAGPYNGVPAGCVTYVPNGSTGWDGIASSQDLPRYWPEGTTYRIDWWEPNRLTVSFDPCDGTAPTAVGQVTGTSYVMPPEPVRQGAAFGGWWTQPENGARVTASTQVTAIGDYTVYAHWTMNRYFVRFDANGGSGTADPFEMTVGTPAALPPCPFGYVAHAFAGWATEPDGATVYADGATVADLSLANNSVVTLYAVWQERDWTVPDYLDAPGLAFETEGGDGWGCDWEDFKVGGASLTSGELPPSEIGGEWTNTVLRTTVVGEGTLSFWWKVSCEPEDDYYDEWYDFATFAVDGVAVARIAGEGSWKKVECVVTGAGTHTLEWAFWRDDYDEDGAGYDNALWVDGVEWTPSPVTLSFAAGEGAGGETPTGVVPAAVVKYAGYALALPGAGSLANPPYIFMGWTDGETVYAAGETFVFGSADVTLTAVWALKPWTLAEAIDAAARVFSTGGTANWAVDAANGWTNGVSAKSGTVATGESSWIETTVYGSGTLSFRWQVMGGIFRNTPFAFAKVEVDGTQVAATHLTEGWEALSLAIEGAGKHTVRWTYLRTSPREAEGDCAWLDAVAWTADAGQDMRELSVANCFGAASPSNGIHVVDMGAEVSAWSTNLVEDGGVRLLCTGWVGTGSVPATGNGTNAVFTLLEDSSIAWAWRTNYFVSVTVVGNGSVDFTEGWIEAGSNLVVTATPGAVYASAAWSGDVEGATPDGLRITLPVDGPRDVAITFETHEGDDGAGIVSGLTAKQRYPWNGLVDISFTLSGTGSGYGIAVIATNTATGMEIPVRTLRDASGNTIDTCGGVTPGAVSLVWDAGADAPGIVVETLALSIVTAQPLPHGRVQLWEGGPYWAKTNIGADEPWDYGLYFWWGDTVGYRREGDVWVASDGSCSYPRFGSDIVPTCNKSLATLQSEGWITAEGALSPSHDAAHVQWGGEWRMPTQQEQADLNNNCDWNWTTVNGVYGCVVSGRDGYASASIFLPAAGSNGYDIGSDGVYWSSVPGADGRDAGFLAFKSSDHSTNLYGYRRFVAMPVRPVQGFADGLAAVMPLAWGDTTTLRLDTRTEPLAADSIAVSWNASWIGGDASATVIIHDNGVEVRRTIGAGEFMHSPTGLGRHELAYTTYIDGVAQEEVYTTVVYKGSFQVTLDHQGGTGGTPSVTAICGAAMPAITVPTRTGYTFGGYWSSAEGSGTQYYSASGESVRNWDGTGATTLYAMWTGATETQTTPVPVPHAWLAGYLLGDGTVDGYEDAAKRMAANGVNKVWECYVAGLNPTNAAETFEATITIGADGKPVVEWNPRLAPEEEAKRVYTIYGRERLDVGGWTSPTNSLHRFFKVGVEMRH